jgi:hypothetical protein
MLFEISQIFVSGEILAAIMTQQNIIEKSEVF